MLHVTFICDAPYALPTLVAMLSVKESRAAGSEVAVHVVTPGLPKETAAAFTALAEPGFSVEIVESEAESLKALHPDDPQSVASARSVALLKFRLPSLFRDLDRILYLDGDILVRGDLSPLWETDLGGASLAAVRDSGTIYWKHPQALRHPGYFNSGVMLLDLAKMRQTGAEARLFAAKRRGVEEGSARFVDQNAFNEVFDGDVRHVSIRWNCMLVNLGRAEGRWSLADIADTYGERFYGFDDLVGKSAIWHFSSKDKPWGPVNVPGRAEWQTLAQRVCAGAAVPGPPLCERVPPAAGACAGAPRRRSPLHRMARIGVSGAVLPVLRAWRRFAGRYHAFMVEEATAALAAKLRDLEPLRRELGFPGINRDKVSCEIEIARRAAGTSRAAGDAVRRPEVVVSLTTFPDRIYDAHFAIHSLLSQTVKPDRVVLWLSDEEFPRRERDLPGVLLALRDRGLEIRFVPGNARSYKKILPALESFPEAVIVTADDDIYYPPSWLGCLLRAHERDPSAVWAVRARRVRPGVPYGEWPVVETMADPEAGAFLPTGAGGVLYPPGSLSARVSDVAAAMRLAPTGDDIWLWAMAALAGTATGLCPGAMPFLQFTNAARESGRSGEFRLYDVNKMANDAQLAAVVAEFPQIAKSSSR